MIHTWLVGALAGVMLAASAAAQTPAQQKPTPAEKPAAAKPAPAPEQPATKPAPTARAARQAPAVPAEVPTGETALGTVSIPRTVTADGKTLGAGRYTVRLTAQSAQPTVPGQLPNLNRWVEFVQGGQVRGREVVSIVPADEVDDTMPGPDMPGHVGRNQQRVEMLKGGDYLRVWINRGGHNYLIHLVPSGAAAR